MATRTLKVTVPAARAVATKRIVKKRTRSSVDGAHSTKLWASLHEFTPVFGPAVPKGRVLTPDGECVTPLAGTRLGLCIQQFAPCPERMCWVYVTQGLPQPANETHKAQRGRECVELVLCWKKQDPKAAARVLAVAAQQLVVESGAAAATQILSGGPEQLPSYQHWLACAPDGGCIPQRAGGVRLILLMGISDAEMQCALKVPPEVADGRQVLQAALRAGGIFPVTDPGRNCLTRRGDFRRLWESAFRLVRERR